MKAAHVAFQRRSGGYKDIEMSILDKRREHYEQLLRKTDFYDYDVWFNLVRMEESNLNSVAGGTTIETVRNIYTRFAQHPPPLRQKTAWKRFFYLFMSFAFFEEFVAAKPALIASVALLGEDKEGREKALEIIEAKYKEFKETLQ